MSQEYFDLLKPVTRAVFLDEYWERAPLHIERSAADYFQPLVSIAGIEALLSAGGLYFPDMQLVNAAIDIPVSDYTDQDRRVLPHRVWNHYRDGGTLVISGADRRFGRLADLCRGVSREFCMRSQANLYLSPGSHQGFKPHYDTHDVFVLQVSGSKVFRFYQSEVELPFTEETFPPDYAIDGAVQETVELTAGDTLYIPRGVVHDAVAQNEVPSLHITLGVYALAVRDILQEMVQVLAESDVALRRSLDMRLPVSDDAWLSLQPLMNHMGGRSIFEEARARLFDEVVIGMTPSSRDQLSAAPALEASQVTIDDAAIISADYIGSRLKLRVPGQVLEFSEPHASAILQWIDNPALSLNDLDSLDEEQRVALLDQLQKIKVLRPKLDS